MQSHDTLCTQLRRDHPATKRTTRNTANLTDLAGRLITRAGNNIRIACNNKAFVHGFYESPLERACEHTVDSAGLDCSNHKGIIRLPGHRLSVDDIVQVAINLVGRQIKLAANTR